MAQKVKVSVTQSGQFGFFTGRTLAFPLSVDRAVCWSDDMLASYADRLGFSYTRQREFDVQNAHYDSLIPAMNALRQAIRNNPGDFDADTDPRYHLLQDITIEVENRRARMARYVLA